MTYNSLFEKTGFRRFRFWTVAIAFAGALTGLGSAAQAAAPLAALTSGVAGQGEFGTIKGRVVWGGDQAPKTNPLVAVGQATKDPSICAASAAIPNNDLVVDPKTKGVKFAFVYL